MVNVQARTKMVMLEALGLDAIDDDSKFIDLGVDSLDAVELVMALEDEFSIEIADDDAENWKTPADVYRDMERLCG